MRLPSYYLVLAFAAADQPLETVQKLSYSYILIPPTVEEYKSLHKIVKKHKKLGAKALKDLGVYEAYQYIQLQYGKPKKVDTAAVNKFDKVVRILSDLPLRKKLEGLLIRKESFTNIYKTLRKGNSWIDVQTIKLYSHYIFNLDILEPRFLISAIDYLLKESNYFLDYRKVLSSTSDDVARWRLGLETDVDMGKMLQQMESQAMFKLYSLLEIERTDRTTAEALKAVSGTIALIENLKQEYSLRDPEQNDLIQRLQQRSKVLLIKHQRKSIEALTDSIEEVSNDVSNQRPKQYNHN